MNLSGSDVIILKDVVYIQAHKLGDRIHDVDLETLDVKVVSEVHGLL